LSGDEVDVDTVQVKGMEKDDELSNLTCMEELLVDVDATGTEAMAFA
jgi:hypothetical protein